MPKQAKISKPLPLFDPIAYVGSVVQIDPEALAADGVIAALIDIDNTLVSRDTHLLGEEVMTWVAALKAAGLKVCLLSNNWHRTVFSYAHSLEVPIVYKAMKPLPFSYRRALGKLGLRRARSGMRFVEKVPAATSTTTTMAAPAPIAPAPITPEAPAVPAQLSPVGRVAVIGDQLFTDVLGARLCGLLPILVEPLSTTDLWYTQLFRRVERVLLCGTRPAKK